MAEQAKTNARMYEGDGDALMKQEHSEFADRLLLLPDALAKLPDPTPRLRLMWGQHLLEDLLAGRYRSLVCAVNSTDNSRGIVSQIASLLPTSQWDERSITQYAAQFDGAGDRVKVIKYDMDALEVLAILRPAGSATMTLAHLASAFKIVADMIARRPTRLPSASVSFLGARANALADRDGREPSFECVLRTMYQAGFTGDVYPAPSLWNLGRTGLFSRYPFPASLDRMRAGGY